MIRPHRVWPVPLVLAAAIFSGFLHAAEETEDDPFSETFMTVTVSYLNQSFLSLGILGDAYVKDTYEDEQAGELLGVHFDLAESVEKQLTLLSKSKQLDAEDVKTITQLAKIAGLIKSQAMTLEDIWNGDESKVKLWNELRDQTAKALAEFGSDARETAEAPATAEKK